MSAVRWRRAATLIALSVTIALGSGCLHRRGPTPTAACSAQPMQVIEGEPVTVTANGSNFNPKHTVAYAWTTNGGKLDNTAAQSARVDSAGVAAGSYTANATITDPKMKKNNTATCSANFRVKAKPMNPPQVSCSANPSTVLSEASSTITAIANSPDKEPITRYTYNASRGVISGTGPTATLDTAGVPPGPITVTVTATDSRNLTGSGTCGVAVEPPATAELPPSPSPPQFPWPPPRASAHMVIDTPLIRASTSKSLGDIDRVLTKALQATGYFEHSYFAVPGGFVLLTRIEHINERTGGAMQDRWSVKPGPATSFSEYIRTLFTAAPGYYRVITLVVTYVAFDETTAGLSQLDANKYLQTGTQVLPPAIAQQKSTNWTKCTALIYEYRRYRGQKESDVQPMSDSTPDIHTQLVASGLWQALGEQ